MDLVWSGAGTEIARFVRLVEFDPLPGNACEMVEREYTSDSEAMMRPLYSAASWISRKPVCPHWIPTASDGELGCLRPPSRSCELPRG
jgi:hypothetical protein